MSADRPYLSDRALLFHATRATQHVEIADIGKMRALADSSSSTNGCPGFSGWQRGSPLIATGPIRT
jgi:hypothetical protein